MFGSGFFLGVSLVWWKGGFVVVWCVERFGRGVLAWIGWESVRAEGFDCNDGGCGEVR